MCTRTCVFEASDLYEPYKLTVIPTNAGAFTNRAVVGSATLNPTYADAVANATVTVTHGGSAPTHSSEPSSHFTG
jgi:hypothetical protein